MGRAALLHQGKLLVAGGALPAFGNFGRAVEDWFNNAPYFASAYDAYVHSLIPVNGGGYLLSGNVTVLPVTGATTDRRRVEAFHLKLGPDGHRDPYYGPGDLNRT